MFRLGEKQKLVVVKQVDFGVYLAETVGNEKDKEKVLLPAKQVPAGVRVGDSLEVFLYKDSEDRLIATTKEPLLVMGQVARLDVAQVGKIGAFLSWGLDKDLFLPFKQQTRRVEPGDSVLVSLYIDKSERLCATMNVYENLLPLEENSLYRKDTSVTGTVYLISENFGAFVAVDDKYQGLIPRKELYAASAKVKVGETITAKIRKVLPDGRMELAVRDKGYLQRETDATEILDMMHRQGGKLPFTDKASPELIREQTGMSKAEFKRAIGKLLKDGEIAIGENSIYLV